MTVKIYTCDLNVPEKREILEEAASKCLTEGGNIQWLQSSTMSASSASHRLTLICTNVTRRNQ